MRPLFVFFAAAALAAAQAPRIGVLDFYGLRKVSEPQVRQALAAREGDPLPASKGDAEERLDKLSGVVESHLEAVCCDEGKVVLYVGIEERGAPHFDLREAPDGDERLPEEIAGAYNRFLEAVEKAGRRGNVGEDLTKGYSRIADLSARAIQDMFPPWPTATWRSFVRCCGIPTMSFSARRQPTSSVMRGIARRP